MVSGFRFQVSGFGVQGSGFVQGLGSQITKFKGSKQRVYGFATITHLRTSGAHDADSGCTRRAGRASHRVSLGSPLALGANRPDGTGISLWTLSSNRSGSSRLALLARLARLACGACLARWPC